MIRKQILLETEILLDILPKVISNKNYDDNEVKLLFLILSHSPIDERSQVEIFSNWLIPLRPTVAQEFVTYLSMEHIDRAKFPAKSILSLIRKMLSDNNYSDEEIRLCFIISYTFDEISNKERDLIFICLLKERPELAKSLTEELALPKPKSSKSKHFFFIPQTRKMQ